MTPGEARLLVDTGTRVTVTPVVEATMGHGRSAWGVFAEAGGRAGLGTDVPVDAPPDLFEPLRDTFRSHRSRPAGSFLAAVTADSARAIGLGDRIGTLKPGKRADLVLFDGLAHLPESADPAGAIVACLGRSDVHTVIVDGRIVKRDGRLTTLDLPELRRVNSGQLVPFVA